jgi:hypothetical protein
MLDVHSWSLLIESCAFISSIATSAVFLIERNSLIRAVAVCKHSLSAVECRRVE